MKLTDKEVVELYIKNNRNDLKGELSFFKSININEAIKFASLSKNKESKKFSHQRRLRKRDLKKANIILSSKVKEIQEIKDFHELYELIKNNTQSIKGIGALYHYDTALRIGSNLGLEPIKVYLQRGSLEGAINLNINCKKSKILEVKNFSQELQKLSAMEIESCLCIYKDRNKKAFNKCSNLHSRG